MQRGVRGGFRLPGIVGLALVLAHPSAFAMEGIQGAYLKGYRDFLTGVLPEPGVQWRYDTYVYSGTERSTIPQGQLTVNFRSVVNVLGATAVTPYRILGGHYAFSVRGAYSDVRADQTVIRPSPFPAVVRSGSLDAFNDVVVTPIIVGWHAGNLHWNASASVWLPVGAYDRTRLVNTGRNVWAWSPQFAVTYLDRKSGWELSGAAVYIMSATNTATNYKSGDLAHFDFAVGKMLSPHVKLGVVGYYVQQVTADSGAGAIAGPRKMRVAGLGPAASVTFDVNGTAVSLVAKYYREFGAQNTTQGDSGTVSVRVKF
jgi:hypothetical protein